MARRMRTPVLQQPAKALAVASLALLLSSSAAAVVRSGDDPHDYPGRWDARVLDIVAFVEKERGHKFDHPVPVEFLDEATFRKEVTAEESDLEDDDRAELDRVAAVFRALGLLEGEVDLFDEVNTVSGDAVVAFYDFKRERIRVRGTVLDDERRATLAHELTHALQDQVFGIDEEHETDGEEFAYTALVEGDAIRVENEWQDAHATDEDADAAEGREVVDELLEKVPAIIVALFGASHALGETFVSVLFATGGIKAIDAAFDEPPRSEEVVIDPFSYLDGDEPHRVQPLDPPGDRAAVDRGDFGALLWYLLLAERLPPDRALAVADGWGGDEYVLVEQDDRTCIRIQYLGDTDADTKAMEDALRDWDRAVPGSPATIERDGDVVRLDSCDPGAGVHLQVRDTAVDALVIPLLRAGIAGGLMEGGAPAAAARCAAQRFIEGLTVADAQRLAHADELSPADGQRIIQAVVACR